MDSGLMPGAAVRKRKLPFCRHGERAAALFSVLCVLMAGCNRPDISPELGLVSGVVTIDGQPAEDVMVSYQPEKGEGNNKSLVGSGSSATTDSSGMFELRYKGGAVKGAVVGTHIVRLQPTAGGGPAGGEEAKKIVNIPAKYNEKTTLKAVVEPGENSLHEFDVKTR